jgi:hypothetical protein
MKKTTRLTIFWIPRILGILFIAFIGLFSLDVFGTGSGFWATLGGFLMHNIPAFVLLAALIIGWRWEWVGTAGFLAGAGWFLSMARRGDWLFGLIFVGIPLVISVLFLAGWLIKKRMQGKPENYAVAG